MTMRDADREFYLMQALQAFESGSLDAYEYSQRVLAIDRATSEAEMARALGQQVAPRPEALVPRPALDPVDLARMMSPVPAKQAKLGGNRYTVLAMVTVVLVLLLLMGVWLTARMHSENSGSSGARAPVAATDATFYASPAAPASPLSSRR